MTSLLLMARQCNEEILFVNVLEANSFYFHFQSPASACIDLK